jgi:outer membrane protein OmpA-like peptidoglycan-associated protein
MICPACGHQNTNDRAPFCGGCGKALRIEPTLGELGAPVMDHPSTIVSPQAPSSPKRMAAIIAACIAGAAAIAGTGLVIWHHSGARTQAASSRSANARETSVAAVSPDADGAGAQSSSAPASAAAPSGDEAPAASAPLAAPAADPSPAASPDLPHAVTTGVPAGFNIAALAAGGEIESVTNGYGPGHLGRLLLDGSPTTVWAPEGDIVYPQEIVFSFYKRDTALVSALVLVPAPDGWGPKRIEVYTSTDSASGAFQEVAAADVNTAVDVDDFPIQTIAFPAVLARYVKLRIVGGPDGALKIGEVQIIEGTRPGYSPMLTRHPEIAKWKQSVRYAAQAGIDWLEPTSMDWQNQTHCFGCHVQAQTLMGLAVAQSNNYIVNARTADELAAFTRSKLDADGHEIDQGSDTHFTPTQFAAMGIAYYDEANGTKTDPALRRYVSWLAAHIKASGELEGDMDEPPIAQGSLMGTANSVVAFMTAFSQTGDPQYKAAADRTLAFIAAAEPVTTQDKVFKIIALSRYGTSAQRNLASRLVQQLQSEQDEDGGWRERAPLKGSSPFATGQVLYAFQEGGVSIETPTFRNGVRYLIATQEGTGAWPAGATDATTDSHRPSEFAPTMWAVIGLAGAIETPTAESMKIDLDKSGRVRLYINFDFNQATIRPDGKPILAEVVKLLQQNPNLNLEVNGHTDNVGTHDYNVPLSQRRAAAVVDALVAAHIARNRLTAGGFGPDQPIESNETEKGRALNRRVELVKP